MGTTTRPLTRRLTSESMTRRSRDLSSSELAMITSIPRSRVTSSTARATVAKNGFETSSMTRPIVSRLIPRFRLEAISLRWNPSCRAAASTRSAVSGRTPASPLTTRETVLKLTPATRATSRTVGRPVVCRDAWERRGDRSAAVSAPTAAVSFDPRSAFRASSGGSCRPLPAERQGALGHGLESARCAVRPERRTRHRGAPKCDASDRQPLTTVSSGPHHATHRQRCHRSAGRGRSGTTRTAMARSVGTLAGSQPGQQMIAPGAASLVHRDGGSDVQDSQSRGDRRARCRAPRDGRDRERRGPERRAHGRARRRLHARHHRARSRSCSSSRRPSAT